MRFATPAITPSARRSRSLSEPGHSAVRRALRRLECPTAHSSLPASHDRSTARAVTSVPWSSRPRLSDTDSATTRGAASSGGVLAIALPASGAWEGRARRRLDARPARKAGRRCHAIGAATPWREQHLCLRGTVVMAPADTRWMKQERPSHGGDLSDDPSMAGSNRVLLLGCVKLKHERPLPARDLYRSPLWVRRRAYAQASRLPWLILSAKHGLVDPDRRIAPYDLALSDLSAAGRRRWGERVTSDLVERFGSVEDMVFEAHAGEAYRRAIKPGLLANAARLEAPLAGLPLGAQLAWYDARVDRAQLPGRTDSRRRLCTRAEVEGALRALDLAPVRVAARDWPGQLTNLSQPGLYSWWVDREGAGDLSAGLGHRVRPGRIYAGQTGATKWPSGTIGKATLASRIGSNHLRGRIRGSTFRLTLAACLTTPLRLNHIDAQHLDAESEQRVSAWMRKHLEVAVLPFLYRDSLGDLEHNVLAELDPPLNLDGMATTPLRATLARLRARRQ